MYTKEEAAAIRQAFWTSFGKYMAPILSASGEKVNWVNYKTGIQHLYFRMNADKNQAYIGIELKHKNPGQAVGLYEQWTGLRKELEESLGEEWHWESLHINETAQPLSRIYTVLEPVNIFKKADWPAIISFLKPRLIKLDTFWVNHRFIFEMMG